MGFHRNTDQHNGDELLLSREDVALFLHTHADCFGYQPNTLDQTELHCQVLYKRNRHAEVEAQQKLMREIQKKKKKRKSKK